MLNKIHDKTIAKMLQGDYELVLNGATKEMSGCKKGEPSNWRKLQFIRNLPIDSLNSVPEHDHGAHVHGEHCNH